MPSKKLKFYWDTCVLLAWLKDEVSAWGEDVIEGIHQQVADVSAGKIIVVTSSITRAEIFCGRLSSEQKHLYSQTFLRDNVIEYSLHRKIADRASSIREYYHARHIEIKVPDAIHLATAMIAGADVLYTLDGAGKRKRPHHLLRLGTSIAGTEVLIRKPERKQIEAVKSVAAAEVSTTSQGDLFVGLI